MNGLSSSPESALTGITRRRLLRWTLWGGGAALAAGAGAFALLRRSAVDARPVPGSIRHLSAAEFHLFERAARVLLPVAGTGLPSLEQVPVVANVDAMAGLLKPAVRKDLAAGLMIFDHAPILSGWHGRRFVELDDAEAVAYFDAWSRGASIQRALATVVKKFVYVGYWRDPATWPVLEFDGPVSERWGLASLGNAPLPEADRRSA